VTFLSSLKTKGAAAILKEREGDTQKIGVKCLVVKD